MPDEVRLWTIGPGDVLREIDRGHLDLEARLENWLAHDVTVLSRDLLVIGRQVESAHGGYIDLLCLDRAGDVVVVELKRDKTPREITAQVLDYASWVRELSHDQVSRIAADYLSGKGQTLNDAFRDRFGSELPDILNEDHSMVVVGSRIDASSERIVRYLSDAHGVRINAATFQYFGGPATAEYIARIFLMEPEAVEQRSSHKGTSKRRRTPSFEEFSEIAQQNGVHSLYAGLIDGLTGPLLHPYTMVTSVAFYGKLDGTARSIVSILPGASSQEQGLAFQVYLWRLATLLDKATAEVEEHLPEAREPWKYHSKADRDLSGFAGYFRTPEEVARFVSLVCDRVVALPVA